MKTNVKIQSIGSIMEHRKSGKSLTQKQKIILLMFEVGSPVTRLDIFHLINSGINDITKQMGYGSVCGRVNSLIKTGSIIWAGYDNNITDRPAELLRLSPKQKEIQIN